MTAVHLAPQSPKTSDTVLVIGANPALQKTLTFNSLQLGQVNRAVEEKEYTGGKGTNFCRAARQYKGGDVSTLLFTFVGGSAGAKVSRLMKEEGLNLCTVEVVAETRTCTTCLDASTGSMTELIGPSFPIASRAATAMDTAIWGYLQQSHVVGLAIVGSLTDGSDPDLYRRWAKMAAEKRKPLLIDAVTGISSALTVPDANFILKVNKDELFKLTETNDIEAAFTFAFDTWSVEILAITDGPSKAFIQKRGEARRTYNITPLEMVVSPLGAGDTADAVFFSEYLHGTEYVEAFRRGLAAASANCKQADAASFTMEDFESILAGISVE